MSVLEIILSIFFPILALPIIWGRINEFRENRKKNKDIRESLKDILNQMNEYSEDSGSIIMMLLSYIDKKWLHQKLGVIISQFRYYEDTDSNFRVKFGENFFILNDKGELVSGWCNRYHIEQYVEDNKPGHPINVRHKAEIEFFQDIAKEFEKLCIEHKEL